MKYEDMLARTAFENQILKFAADNNDPYAITYHPKDLMGGVSTVPVTRDARKPMTPEERSKFYTDSYNPTLKPEIRRSAGDSKTDAQKNQERQLAENTRTPASEPKTEVAAEELSPWESYKRDYKLYEYADPPTSEPVDSPAPSIKTDTANPPEIKGLDKKKIADTVDTGLHYKDIYQQEYNKLEQAGKYPTNVPFGIFNGILGLREQKAAENAQNRIAEEKKQKEINEQIEKMISDYMAQERASKAIANAPSVDESDKKVSKVGEE